MVGEGDDRGFHPELWRAECPSLRAFVWKPSQAHLDFASEEGNMWYRNGLVDFNSVVFDSWPALERFERPRIEDTVRPRDPEGAAIKLEDVRHYAFTRGGDGGVVGRRCRYDRFRWHEA